MLKRHKFLYAALVPLVRLFLRIKFGYKFKRIRNRELPEKYIVLANHTTDYDPLFVGSSFSRQMYFVGSEHISRWKTAYKLLRWAFDPIMRPKGTTAYSTVMEVLRKIRAGASVCIFAEGARSWDGITGPILPSTGKMVKSAKCALITYKIEGGYFISPNWSESNTRRGRIYGAPVNIYTADQLAAMSVDEINEIINRDLYEDAYERQIASPAKYKGKDLAFRMENMHFICPECGAVDSIRSHKDTVECTKCGMKFRYNEYGMLEDAPFTTVRELFAWLKGKVAEDAANGVSYTAESCRLIQVSKHTETLVCEGPLSFGKDGFRCGDLSIPLENIADMAMHGRRALVFSAKDVYYELFPSEEANSLKFHLLYLALNEKK